jgi:thymidylate synthase (FAD)
MRVIRPQVIIEDDLEMEMPNGLSLAEHMAKKIEGFARKCYKSEGKMTKDSHKEFLSRLFTRNQHTGIAEHRLISVTFITDRGVSHEGVRHRMAAYLQESTRYCDYAKEGEKNNGVTYILPPWVTPQKNRGIVEGSLDENLEWCDFLDDLHADDERYARYRNKPVRSWTPEKARYWLPQGVKTEYAASLNLGSWHNFLTKRTAPAAHPQIRQLAIPLLRYFQEHLPQFYSNIKMPEGANGMFLHKSDLYPEAKLIVNPYYEPIDFDVVYSD